MRVLALVFALLVSGCLSREAPKFAVEPAVPAKPATVATSARTILVAKVSLPSYAKESRIAVQNETGGIVGLPDADWADDPERAMSYALVRHLTQISGRKVAVDPWPLDGLPDAEVRVRVEELLSSKNGLLRLSGQFAVRRDERPNLNKLVPFEISVPVSSSSPTDVVAAYDLAWQRLALVIAKSI